jgi:predicted membrane channel-forming protein YqfA (hemolysin III family)
MTMPLGPPPDARNETPHERADRNLVELLQEMRVAQTGVQVLFGFLLMVPFTARFDASTTFQRVVYLVTVLSAGAAAMLLIAPTAHHRMLFRCDDKEHLVRVTHRYAIAGLVAVAGSMVGVVLLVCEVLFGPVVAGAATALAVAGSVWCWYLQPLLRRRRLLEVAGQPERANASRPRTTVRAT